MRRRPMPTARLSKEERIIVGYITDRLEMAYRDANGKAVYARSMDQVIGAIRDFDSYQERYGQSYARFTQKFCPLDDGHAAERVIDAVFGTGK